MKPFCANPILAIKLGLLQLLGLSLIVTLASGCMSIAMHVARIKEPETMLEESDWETANYPYAGTRIDFGGITEPFTVKGREELKQWGEFKGYYFIMYPFILADLGASIGLDTTLLPYDVVYMARLHTKPKIQKKAN